jgi:hypothetical protein
MSNRDLAQGLYWKCDSRICIKGSKLKTRILAISVFILLISTYLFSISTTFAAVGGGEWITEYRIEDATTGNLILSKDFTTGASSGTGQISDGAQLKVTVTIDVATSNPSSSLTLSTEMQHPSDLDHYWVHGAGDGYSLGGNYNPNAASFSFSQAAGILTISCYGEASGKVATTVGGITLHKAVPINLIALKDPSGTLLDAVRQNITDSAINEYNTKLKAKQDTLAGYAGSGVDPGYVELYQNVITQSKAVADQGLTDNAVAMLDSLDVASPPAGAVMQILFLPLIVVFAVIAVLFAFLFMRNRGKVSYFKLVVEDQIKDLEGLTLRASKIDRTISSNLSSIEDRLKRLVGM